MKIVQKTKVYNNTTYSKEVIEQLPLIGETVSKWRQRNIKLLKHPNDETRLISVGTNFDNSQTVVSDDDRKDWATALDYIAHGKVYVAE